jgi:hypothetical protein
VPQRLLADRGRATLFLIMVALALLFAAAGPASRLEIWRIFGVPTLVPTFADARVITSGWECARQGRDPLADNPCDPFHRVMNYPRIWMAPALIADIGQGWTGRLAATFAACFLLAILAIAGRIGIGTAAVYAIALASPSVMLALERGNSDLLIFALVASAAVLSARDQVVGSVIALAVAIVFKLYPLAALLALRDRRAQAAVVIIAAAYLVAIAGDVGLNLEHTSRQIGWSYGLVNSSVTLLPGISAPTAQLLLAVAGLLIAVLVAWVRPMPPVSTMAGTTFAAGAGIYVATFILGPSFDYRLIFLLLTLPALLELARGARGRVMLILVLAALWTSRDAIAPGFWIDQLFKLAVAVGLVAMLLGARVRSLALHQPPAARGARPRSSRRPRCRTRRPVRGPDLHAAAWASAFLRLWVNLGRHAGEDDRVPRARPRCGRPLPPVDRPLPAAPPWPPDRLPASS